MRSTEGRKWLTPPCIFIARRSACGICLLTGARSIALLFQAEDGIRDLTVTGVQTCALPISGVSGPRSRCVFDGECAGTRVLRAGRHRNADENQRGLSRIEPDLCVVADSAFPAGGRSEERRVGKECRSRWSPYH